MSKPFVYVYQDGSYQIVDGWPDSLRGTPVGTYCYDGEEWMHVVSDTGSVRFPPKDKLPACCKVVELIYPSSK